MAKQPSCSLPFAPKWSHTSLYALQTGRRGKFHWLFKIGKKAEIQEWEVWGCPSSSPTTPVRDGKWRPRSSLRYEMGKLPILTLVLKLKTTLDPRWPLMTPRFGCVGRWGKLPRLTKFHRRARGDRRVFLTLINARLRLWLPSSPLASPWQVAVAGEKRPKK